MTNHRNASVKRVYLINPSFSWNASRVNLDHQIVQKPPTGLLYLAANLKKHGVDSVVIDQNVNRISFENIVELLKQQDLFFVGIYSDYYLKPHALALIDLIKCERTETKVVVGGPACSEYLLFHQHGVDVVCHGEGDQVVSELVDCYSGKLELASIRGISYLQDGQVMTNPERPPIEDLDSIPFPAFEKAAMNAYYDYHIFGMTRPFFSLIASRGCPFRCAYCSSHDFWQNRYRLRSPKNVVDEMDTLVNLYGIRYLAFNDDLFGYRTDWLYAFIGELRNRKLDVKFYCLLNPASFIDDRQRLLSLLRSVGLDIIVVGLQSVDPCVLRNIHRDPKHPEQLAELVQMAKRLGITTAIHFIFGLPGDSLDVFKRNIDYALTVRPHYALFYMLEKLPGSEMFARFGNQPTTSLSDATIRTWVNFAQARFFADPRVIVQNLVHVLSKRPSWFLVGLRNFYYLSQAAINPYARS